MASPRAATRRRDRSQEDETMATTGTPRQQGEDTTDQDPKAIAQDVAQQAAAGVRNVADELAQRLPDAAATTRSAVEDAARRMEAGSDEMLSAGTTLSLGLAIGLLIGGANRFLVALALIPAAAMGMTLLERRSGSMGGGSIGSARRPRA
jgi:hypothetical protein